MIAAFATVMIMARDGAPEVTLLSDTSPPLLFVFSESKKSFTTPLRNDYYYIVIIIPLTANDPYGCGRAEEELLRRKSFIKVGHFLVFKAQNARENAVFDQNGSTLTKVRRKRGYG